MSFLKRLVPRALKDEIKEAVANVAWQRTGPRIERLEGRSEGPGTKVADLETAVEQLTAVLRHEGIVMPPPKHMQIRVVGAYVGGFIESGFSICDDLNGVLAVVGKSLESFPRILDWGCGCGRTARAVKTLVPGCELHGTDIDEEAIGFLQRCYARYGEFRVAPHRPPTSFPDDFFDFVFGVSIFTHLPEDMQFEWLAELSRITRPGAHLIVTTSGEPNYKLMPPEYVARVERDGFLYVDGGYGQSINLPAFYQNTFHTHDYIRRKWTRYFDVIDIQTQRMQRHQDTILLRNRKPAR